MGKTQEIVKTTENQVSVVDVLNFYNEQGNDVSHRDLMIPKLLAMQGLSKLVSDGAAKFGDLINNVTMEVVADFKKPTKILPFLCKKVFTVSKWEGNKWVFQKIIEVSPNNLNTPYEVTENGEKYKYEYTYNYFCLLKGEKVPVVVGFKGSSEKEGKKLYTQMFVLNKANGKSPCGKWIELGTSKKENDKGTFTILATKVDSDASNEEQIECIKWARTIADSAVTIVEDVEHEQETQPTVNSQF